MLGENVVCGSSRVHRFCAGAYLSHQPVGFTQRPYNQGGDGRGKEIRGNIHTASSLPLRSLDTIDRGDRERTRAATVPASGRTPRTCWPLYARTGHLARGQTPIRLRAARRIALFIARPYGDMVLRRPAAVHTHSIALGSFTPSLKVHDQSV